MKEGLRLVVLFLRHHLVVPPTSTDLATWISKILPSPGFPVLAVAVITSEWVSGYHAFEVVQKAKTVTYSPKKSELWWVISPPQ